MGIETERLAAEDLALFGRRGSRSSDEERVALSALPPATRRIVLRRARVMEDHLALPRRTAVDADLAAAQLGIGRSLFYRLLERYRGEGLKGLAPRPRHAPAGSRRDPNFEWVADELAKSLAEDPNARFTDLVNALAVEAALRGVVPPSAPAIRRRLSEVRRDGVAATHAGAGLGFGRELLIDQSALDRWVEPRRWGRGDPWPPVGMFRAVATVVADVDSGLLIGVGVSPRAGGSLGLEGALKEADDFWDRAMIGTMQHKDLVKVTWVIPPGGGALARPFVENARRLGIETDVISSGDRRHGERLRRIVGDQLGPYRLMPRMTEKPQFCKGPEPRPGDADAPGQVAAALADAVDEHNLEVVRRFEGRRPTSHAATRARRVREWTRGDRLTAQADDWLAHLLLPWKDSDDLNPSWGVHARLRMILEPASPGRTVGASPSRVVEGDEPTHRVARDFELDLDDVPAVDRVLPKTGT